MCVDLREPNKAIVIDCYPLPHMEDLFSELRGSKIFSTIDLASAYHQVPLHAHGTWLSDNKLSIHLGKTESILFGSNFNLNKVDNFAIKVGNSVITRKNKITYLGCILEANLSSDVMTSKVIKIIQPKNTFSTQDRLTGQ